MRTYRTLAGAGITALIVLTSTAAGAWPPPTASAAGGACTGTSRAPIVWSVHNLETAFPLSPARIESVVVTPSLPTSAFSPTVLPNTGTSVATATTVVPPSFTGTVELSFRMVWSGPDGSDQRDGSASVTVSSCPMAEPPPTTATSTTTTTTTAPTTTTTTTVFPMAVAGETLDAEDVPADGPPFVAVAGAYVEAAPASVPQATAAVPVELAAEPMLAG